MTKTKTQRISNPTSPRLLTIPKAAEYLGLTKWAMRERVWAGQIPYVQFPGGRKIYIDVSDLEAFIEKNKRIFD
jgi:excisionase family DNA binding protein